MVRPLIFVPLVAFCISVLSFPSGLRAEETKSPSKSPLVVHEWGTFTSFAGSDGVNLDFRPLVDSDLPRFVYSAGLTPFSKKTLYARQRMETPVTYFYSDVERDVNVSVGFRRGRLTEFYPPPIAHHSKLAADQKTVAEERIDWGKVHIIPNRLLETHISNPEVSGRVNRHIAMGLVPWLEDYNPYYKARETDSALLFVRRTPDQGPLASTAAYDFRGDHFEKFLFYRGAGQIDLPLQAVAIDQNSVHVENRTQQPIRGGLVVHSTGQELRFAAIGTVGAGSKVDATLPEWHLVRQTDQFAALDQQLTRQLVGEGLYEKEAKSMVNTWRDSWYRETGLRVFFFVPQSQTDEILPLTIDPKPDQVVRVLVARTELMTPAEERQIVSLLDRSADDGSLIEQLVKELAPRGRLAEPALRRCAALSRAKNPSVLVDRILLDRILPLLSTARG